MKTLNELYIWQAQLEKESSELRSRTKIVNSNLDYVEREIQRRPTVDSTVEERAASLLSVRGDFSRVVKYSEGVGMIKSAIFDIVQNGGKRLRSERFGVKSYDRWQCQRSDHTYGYGPKHGDVWASIGFARDFIKQNRGLSDDESSACVAYLHALKTGAQLKAA